MKTIQERIMSISAQYSGRTLADPLAATRSASSRLPVLAERRPNPTRLATLPAVAGTLTRTAPAITVRDVTVRPHTPQVQRVPVLKKQERFPVAALDFSKKDVGLPYGVPRRVSARTLKELAGGGRTDQLLKKTPAGWEFVEDSTLVDLSDNKVQFKLGRLTIFS